MFTNMACPSERSVNTKHFLRPSVGHIATQSAASQEGLSSTKLVIQLVISKPYKIIERKIFSPPLYYRFSSPLLVALTRILTIYSAACFDIFSGIAVSSVHLAYERIKFRIAGFIVRYKSHVYNVYSDRI
jgi:hypothetical protein